MFIWVTHFWLSALAVCSQLVPAIGQSIEFAFIPSNKFLITQYMERHISEDLVKRRSSCLLHNQTQPKRQWASLWLPALWATSCLITDHPSSCRVSWPLASWLFGLSLHLILLFSGPCTVLLSSSILSPHTHSSIQLPMYQTPL